MALLDQTFEILELILLVPVRHVLLHHPNDTTNLVVLEINLGKRKNEMKIGNHILT